ncbi:hypothetical protein [Chitinivibrio alkaliphilus]|nr:hypothetical protein [Chitinivibrio alkaliphilus]
MRLRRAQPPGEIPLPSRNEAPLFYPDPPSSQDEALRQPFEIDVLY